MLSSITNKIKSAVHHDKAADVHHEGPVTDASLKTTDHTNPPVTRSVPQSGVNTLPGTSNPTANPNVAPAAEGHQYGEGVIGGMAGATNEPGHFTSKAPGAPGNGLLPHAPEASAKVHPNATTAANPDARLHGILTVTVLEAENLAKMDWTGENDNYVIVELDHTPAGQAQAAIHDIKEPTESAQRTQVQPGASPIWNERLVFPVPQSSSGTVPTSLRVSIWDEDYNAHDLVGAGIVAVPQGFLTANKQGMLTQWVELRHKDKPAGKVCLVLHFVPETMFDYMGKKYNNAAAAAKKKVIAAVVGKVTSTAQSQIMGYVA
ncbi:C2 domain-containing protein [Fimicolochytrium jonesii]|uniref:C2 domain-containing protein n=1 Tax=Fimicolochytrium jonesii TaxID=1396493 RepID=UPI0022FF1E69|nr:C2 domain-containing protein [Fimicolochytrium jonesii]KAI8816757.1 C2 domain-containing protein [Fimicolochytrium jonesii]